ncbi:MAG TPA: 3-phosphoshikimate 1-carboxyvinyltransferase [Syntrophomonadaceae bacterium]|nr:3-phosphoshikimate 1-carboxyvinyltransferase [Syntrophomonadaceae bacterium]HQE23877.1 3-phosphoshikimate 1-carboxyvinyltransferase [Syntrophomonadaceae bacterium]
MQAVINKVPYLKGETEVAPDKSISHRTVILSALAKGRSRVKNFLEAEDTLSSCSCLQALGLTIQKQDIDLVIDSPGINGLQEPDRVLDCGNSGTTMRMLAGLLAGRPFMTVLSGDSSLNRRPMQRIISPLSMMGAKFMARSSNYPPLAVQGGQLQGIEYHMPVSSAQVKSALLLAGLQAEGVTTVYEDQSSRDHTERMLTAMGAQVEMQPGQVRVIPGAILSPQDWEVPGDISSAAFLLVAATIVPNSEVLIKSVGVNPTRDGILEVLKQMGARITVQNARTVAGEPVADLLVQSAPLKAMEIQGTIIPRLIDELPVIAVAMAAAEGVSVVRDAAELRVKETDRIAAVCSQLDRMGVAIEATPDGFVVDGSKSHLQGAAVDSFGDHRIAMSLAVAGLIADQTTYINNAEAVNISYPGFWDTILSLSR